MKPLLIHHIRDLLTRAAKGEVPEPEAYCQMILAHSSDKYQSLDEITLEPIGQKRREKLLHLFGNRCAFCQTETITDKMNIGIMPRDKVKDYATVDHIIPKAMGGPDTIENCVIACFQCNQQKVANGLLPKNDLQPF